MIAQIDMVLIWYRWLHRCCNWRYFSRVTVLQAERLPESGPTIYLGLHRNGAVDGFIYHCVVPQATFMLSTQLRRKLLGRLFFTGIEVVRDRDEGNQTNNQAALAKCLEHLRAGRALFVFPEGTSSLGPRHLPFKSGAARLLAQYLERPDPIHVVPLGIIYERGWAFRSRVEVVVGEPVSVESLHTLETVGRVKELRQRILSGLESVGVNVASEHDQKLVEQLACVATLGTRRSYFKSLKAFERGVPEKILSAWRTLQPERETKALLFYQDVALLPGGSVWVNALALLLAAPPVAAGALFNFPPLVAGWWAGTKFPDGPNVVSLWRILVGVPVSVIWLLMISAAAVGTRRPLWLGCYLLISLVGLKLYCRVKKLAVAVHNGIRHPELRARMVAFHETVLHEIPDEE